MNKFAITIPNLNQSRFLPTAIESIRLQKRPFDLSIMDGGSNDNFLEVIKDHKDVVGYWRSKKDSGQSAAIAEGWRHVDGNILCWINSDDYYFPNCFEIVDKTFKQNKDVDVVYGDAIHVDAHGQFISYFPAIKKYDKKRIGYDCYICQPACFIRKNIYEKIIGIRSNLEYTMDWDLWCQLSKKGVKFEYVHKPLAAVRYYKGTKTLSNNLYRYKEIIRIEKRYANRILPLSVFGADFYGMTLEEKKSFIPYLYMIIFNFLRKMKRIFISNGNIKNNPDNAPLYGIERWGNKVHRECEIYLPWYSSHNWKKMIIYTQEKCSNLNIQINGQSVECNECEDGQIHIRLLSKWRPCIKLVIKSIKHNIWILNRIECI